MQANLIPERVTYGTGFMSQKLTLVQRVVSRVHPLLGWAVVLPLRLLQLVDRPVTGAIGWPYFSIRLEAYKPRYDPRPAQPSYETPLQENAHASRY
jgi:hypothetical protein